MNDSILTSIKKLLGIAEEYDNFDADIIMHINSVFMILNQLGIGPSEGFRIEDKTTEWSEYVSEDENLDAVKTYMHLRVKMLFDPPQGSGVMESYNRSINELEWRLNVTTDYHNKEV